MKQKNKSSFMLHIIPPLSLKTHTPDLLHLLPLQHITQRFTVSMDRFDFSQSPVWMLDTALVVVAYKLMLPSLPANTAYIGYTRFYISHKQGFLHIFDKMSTKCILKYLSSFVGFWYDKLAVNRCLVRVETIFNFIWKKQSVQCLTSWMWHSFRQHWKHLVSANFWPLITQWKCVICNLPIC